MLNFLITKMSLLALVVMVIVGVFGDDEETCQLSPTSIHITKEDHDVVGNVVRICEGDIVINKCEGTCISSLQPSVTHPNGFLKKCICCRESQMNIKHVVLAVCYDTNGKRLTSDHQLATMRISMQEPDKCDCYKCGI